MTFLPRQENLIDEALEIIGLSHSFFVEQCNFSTFQYITKEIESRAQRILIEKILALSIKYRFLDDRMSLIKDYDRKISSLGKYIIDGEQLNKASVREALNKIIHHNEIELIIKQKRQVVVKGVPDDNEIQIAKGQYEFNILILLVKGKYSKKEWSFHIDIFTLINELLRIEHLSAFGK